MGLEEYIQGKEAQGKGFFLHVKREELLINIL